MQTCILHAGMPKTGSTAIQSAFSGYKKKGMVYADLGPTNHGEPLISAFADRPEDFYIYRNRDLSRDQCRKRSRAARGVLDKVVRTNTSMIFSSEAIVDHLKPHEIARLLRYLKDHAQNLQIIIYVRPYTSLISSQMQERIKAGAGRFALPKPKYRDRFEPFISAAGREHITFVRYNRSDLIGADIVSDFAYRIGADLPTIEPMPANETLSARAIATIFAFNKFIAPALPIRDRTNMRNTLRAQVAPLAGPKFRLHPSLISQQIEKIQDDLDWAEATCGFDVKGEMIGNLDGISGEADLLKIALGD